MPKTKEITLSREELDELKDEIRFREKVVLQLKQLNGIPKRVWKLETQMSIHFALILAVVTGIIGVALKVLAG